MTHIIEIDEIVQEEIVDQEEEKWTERKANIQVQGVEEKPNERDYNKKQMKTLWKQQEESLIKITGVQYCRLVEKNEDFAVGSHW